MNDQEKNAACGAEQSQNQADGNVSVSQNNELPKEKADGINSASGTTGQDAASQDPASSLPSASSRQNQSAANISGNDGQDEWTSPPTYWQGEESGTASETGRNNDGESDAKSSGLPFENAKSDASANPEAEEAEGKSMGLLDHLGELRQRLVRSVIFAAIGFAICWGFVDQLFDIIMHPLLAVLPDGTHAQYTTLPEAFFTRMEIAFVAGLFLASPAIFYQIWAFVAPGLYDDEKKYIIPIAFLSAVFFIAGGLFCYFIVFPFAFNFFISYSTPEIVMTPKISDYLSFVLKLIFAFGIIFEMPIFTLFLARLGILSAAMMRRFRKYAIVIIFILAAILTPPDVISQLLMACPMLILYELSIGVAVIFGRKRPKPEQTENENGEA